MRLIVSLLLVGASLFVGATRNGSEDTVPILVESPADGSLRYVLEKLLERFDSMESKLMELQMEVFEHREDVERHRMTNEMTFVDLLWAIHRLEQDVGRNMSVIQDLSLVILDQQKSCANHDRLREQLFNYLPKRNHSSYKTQGRSLFSYRPLQLDTSTSTTTQATVIEPPIYASCKDAPANVSGEYFIRFNNASSPIKVWCEQMEFGGGWIVIQQRFDGSVDFYRNWTECREGFGEVGKEFWLGLEHVHQLTTARKCELLVEVKDFNGTYGYAHYNSFQVGSEVDQYILKSVGSYNGTAGNSLTKHVEKKFSTPDRNNGGGANSAISYEGPWWHGSPIYANLNGPYKNTAHNKSILWYHLKSDYRGMSYSRMMIR